MTFEKLQKFHSRMLRKQGDKVLNVGVCENLSQQAEPALFLRVCSVIMRFAVPVSSSEDASPCPANGDSLHIGVCALYVSAYEDKRPHQVAGLQE